MNKALKKNLMITGAIIASGVIGTSAIVSTNKMNTLKKELEIKHTEYEELEENILELEKAIKEYEEENKKSKEVLEETLKKLEDAESRISQIQKETGIYNFRSVTEIEWVVSYYTDLAVENSLEYGGVNATGEKLKNGMVANNNLKLGTKIYVEGFGIRTVEDRGSEKYFSNTNRIDMFIARSPGESDSKYYKRVNDLGIDRLKGYIFEF